MMVPSCSDTEIIMEEAKVKKQNLRNETREKLAALSESEIKEKTDLLTNQLLDFANFLESETALFYLKPDYIVDTRRIIKICLSLPKQIALPSFGPDKRITLWKINNLDEDLLPDGFTPNQDRCKMVPFDDIDIAIIPGIAFDEKGGRLGTGRGDYDRMIPKLPNTVRKVALALTEQVLPGLPMESHDKFVDIIITDSRIIYKI